MLQSFISLWTSLSQSSWVLPLLLPPNFHEYHTGPFCRTRSRSPEDKWTDAGENTSSAAAICHELSIFNSLMPVSLIWHGADENQYNTCNESSKRPISLQARVSSVCENSLHLDNMNQLVTYILLSGVSLKPHDEITVITVLVWLSVWAITLL